MKEKPLGRERLRVALIGCGDIAETGHVPALLKHPRFELAVLCDTRAPRTERLSKLAGGVPTCVDYRPLLSRGDIDAVILALHPEISVDIACAFLRHNKPVLDEKPLAATLEEGQRLARVVAESRGVYQIGFVMRYCEMVRAVAQFAGLIGTPASYRVGVFDERLDRANPAHYDRIQQIFRKSSAITHEGSHVIDYFQQWNPAPIGSVHPSAVQTLPEFAGPNIWTAQLQTADGSLLELNIGWMVPELLASTVEICGPQGALHLDLCTGRGQFAHKGQREAIAVPPIRQDWQRQLDAFAAAIDAGTASSATITDGLRALSVTTACERSHHEGTTCKV